MGRHCYRWKRTAAMGGLRTFAEAKVSRGVAPIPVGREAAPRPPKPVIYFPVTPDRRSIKIGAKVVSYGRLPHGQDSQGRSLAADPAKVGKIPGTNRALSTERLGEPE